MKAQGTTIVWVGFLVGCLGMFGCVKRDTTPVKATKAQITLQGCVKGKLVKEEDNTPMAYVAVLTKPSTSPQVTDKNGIFEICYQRKQQKKNGMVRAPITLGQYTLIVDKENFKTKRVRFAFKGKSVNLGVIQLRHKSVNLPDDVKQTRKIEGDKDSGIVGPAPKGS